MSDIVGIELLLLLYLHRFRNESSFARSDAVMLSRDYHAEIAGRQYMILARIVARNSSWSDSVEMP